MQEGNMQEENNMREEGWINGSFGRHIVRTRGMPWILQDYTK
jgi:hypothetical protein